MRKLVYLVLGFAGACGLWCFVLTGGAVVPLSLAAGLASLVLGRLGWRRTALYALGCAIGLGWCAGYGAVMLRECRALDGTTAEATVHISDYSEPTAYGIAAEGWLSAEGKPYRVRVYLNQQTPMEPGAEITATFRFRATVPGGAEKVTYQSGKGIFLLAYQRGGEAETTRADSYRDIPARMRQRIRQTLEQSMPRDTVAFAKALLLGDTSEIDYATDTALKISGIRHIIAVSGLHVSIFFGAMELLTLKKRYLTAVLAFPGLFLLAAVIGFTPSVNRACLMIGLMLLARLTDREYDGPTALAFAVAVLLLVNPLTIASVSFQLSVASVAGIYLFAPGIARWLGTLFGEVKPRTLKERLVRWFTSSVSVTLSAMILTTPLCAWYFGTVSLISVVTNLVTLWVVSILFCGLVAVTLLYPVWHWGAQALGWCLSWGARYVLGAAKLLSGLPLAAVYTASPYIVAWLVFVYVLLGAFLLSRNRRPAVLSACACTGLCLALLCSWAERDMDDVRLTVLDVGQGQCLLLQSEGRTYMVDCGGDSDTEAADLAAETLLSQGIRRLDGLILTHCDRDHAGGAGLLLSRVPTELLILPENATLDTQTSTVYAGEELELRFGDAQLQIFPPAYPGNSNESSLCVLFETEKCDILITGDRSGFGERSLLRHADIGQVDVLIAGHHGAKDSTCEELLAATQPELVCVSAGRDNAYGHPAPETLERLAKAGCQVYRTDQLGTITIRR